MNGQEPVTQGVYRPGMNPVNLTVKMCAANVGRQMDRDTDRQQITGHRISSP